MPFRSIAVDPTVFPLGRWYFVPELVGVTLPPLAASNPASGASKPAASSEPVRVHDGCVRADDIGSAVRGEMVDLFVGPRSALVALTPMLSDRMFRMAPADERCAATAQANGAFSGTGAP
jgi:3D (Asp-Asp-Asp) domain-containing protein